MNKILLIGRTTKDIKFSLKGDLKIANFSLAIDREGTDKTDFIPVAVFGKLADIVNQYVTKGSKVLVEGTLQTSSYEKEGTKHYTMNVVGSKVTFIEIKK